MKKFYQIQGDRNMNKEMELDNWDNNGNNNEWIDDEMKDNDMNDNQMDEKINKYIDDRIKYRRKKIKKKKRRNRKENIDENFTNGLFYINHLKRIEQAFPNGICNTVDIRNGMRLIYYNISIAKRINSNSRNNNTNNINNNDDNDNDDNNNKNNGIYKIKKCPFCNVEWEVNGMSCIIPPYSGNDIRGIDDPVRHFIHRCKKIMIDTQNERNEMKLRAEASEQFKELELDGVSIRDICIIGDYVAKNLNINDF